MEAALRRSASLPEEVFARGLVGLADAVGGLTEVFRSPVYRTRDLSVELGYSGKRLDSSQ